MAQTIMMFNPANFDQRLIDVSSTTLIDQLKEKGWKENPPLVSMYHPGQRLHKTVMVEQRADWEARGYFAEPTVVYHPEHGSRTVSREHAQKLLSDGWFDSPAAYPKPKILSPGAQLAGKKGKEAA